MIIGIDGPAGSGKTTVAKLLAKNLHISYLDTGATYRALTLKSLDSGANLTDEGTLKELAMGLNLSFDKELTKLDGLDVSNRIREPLVDKSISIVVSFPEVRQVMVSLQRKLAGNGDFVVEGRDVTTVVFPDAKHKFYLDADVQVRSQRRFKELRQKGLDVNFQEVSEDLKRRDYEDKNRAVGALKIGENTLVIDATNLTIKETVEAIIKHIESAE